MICFHKWSKWQEYIQKFNKYPGILAPKEMQGKPISYSEEWQKRECLKCGKVQREEVRGS